MPQPNPATDSPALPAASLALALLTPPTYCSTQFALSSFTRWVIANGHVAHAYWLERQAVSARLGLPFAECDLEAFCRQEYARAFEDSLSLSIGDDPDADDFDDGDAA